MTFPVRAQPFVTPMRRGRLLACSRRHHPVDGPERPSGRTASPSGITPSHIMSPARSQPGSRTEVRLGARAHTTRTTNRAHAPPSPPQLNPDNPDPALDTGPRTSKDQRGRASAPATATSARAVPARLVGCCRAAPGVRSIGLPLRPCAARLTSAGSSGNISAAAIARAGRARRGSSGPIFRRENEYTDRPRVWSVPAPGDVSGRAGGVGGACVG
jgi:hypothetical protein